MARRALAIAAASGAIVAGLLVFARDRATSHAPAPASPQQGEAAPAARPTQPALPAIAHAQAHPPPRLPTRVDDAPITTPDTFAAEPRDAVWATEIEHELQDRLAHVIAEHAPGVEVAPIECHRQLCRIRIVAPNDDAIGPFLAGLESEDGLLGFADTILLGRVDRGLDSDDGMVRTEAFARFER